MNDAELKQLLAETHQVGPGHEARQWARFQARLFADAQPAQRRLPTWAFAGAGVAALVLAFTWFALPGHIPMVSAQSQAPGIFATAFYSPAAQAQVVWLNGVDPASDAPSYLDPTSVLVGDSPAHGRF
jgi:hypothetical protein